MTKTFKLGNKAYCKYCYKTHSNWYDDGNHDHGIFVCGICEHASKLIFS